MKKRLMIISSIIILGCSNLFAQNDGFFSNGNYSEYREENNEWGTMPLLPTSHGSQYDFAAEAPLGSGIVLLAAMGLAYGRKKLKVES